MADLNPGQPPAEPAWRWLGERGLRLATADTTLARFSLLKAGNFDELEDIVPADGSILLVLRPGAQPGSALRAAMTAPLSPAPAVSAAEHLIPVSFGGAAGADFFECAGRAGLAPTDYVATLTATVFTVAFLGFQPGFPYLTGLPERLAASRRATPRTRVAAGSVAIGGPYAGIYPADGPGGWNLLGSTAVRLFDPARSRPALLEPGDRVRFVAVRP